MDPFDEREKGFEAKFQLDEEMAFRVSARRDKLLGLWVAGQIGLVGDEAETYAKAALDSAIGATHDVMIDKLVADLTAHSAAVGADEVRAEFNRLNHLAHAQIAEELGKGELKVSP